MVFENQTSISDKRIVFAGGIDWSAEFLKLLVNEGFNIVGVMTPPNSKKDRGQKMAVHTLKSEAEKLNIPVFQPERLSDPNFLIQFKKLKPYLVLVVAYGKLFPKEILEIPPKGFINFHPSLLPKLRGPSPIASAILEGFTETGVSIMKLKEGMDDGPILAQKNVKIDQRETAETLTRKLVDLGKEILPGVLKKYLNVETGHASSLLKKQDNTQASYCKINKKTYAKIVWQNETAEKIDRKIRALNPQFKTFTFLKDSKRVNILESAGVSAKQTQSGRYKLTDNYLAIGTKKGTLLISRLQVEGKNPVSGKEFIQGYGRSHFSS